MTNFEFWKDEILRICRKNKSHPAIVNGKPVSCNQIQCNECDFNNVNCFSHSIEWLYKEHVEKLNLTKRERAFCELIEKGWVGRDPDGSLHWYESKPEKFRERWVLNIGISSILNLKILNLDFEFIKWEDSEPWAISDLLKLEVMEVQEDA